MPRKARSCDICGDKHYAKGFCKKCYMHSNRDKFNTNPNKRSLQEPSPEFDPEDFWQFVKKELKLG